MNTATIHAEIELIGYTSKGVILNLGDDRGMTVGRVIDARELLRSNLFNLLAYQDRRLVVAIASHHR
jgi:hypothetical protein